MPDDQDTFEISLVRSDRNAELTIEFPKRLFKFINGLSHVCSLRQLPLHSYHRIHKVNESLDTFFCAVCIRRHS
jgi:hypothetical protein